MDGWGIDGGVDGDGNSNVDAQVDRRLMAMAKQQYR